MLDRDRLVAFIATADANRARAFYEGVLGLTFVADHGQLLVFDSGPSRLMIERVDAVTPRSGTVLGWNVKDLRRRIHDLMARGVVFERFEGMDQDDLGVWRPAGADSGVAWFKDPDGNLLSLSLA